MKLNWGHYLTIGMTLFIGFIISLIVFVGGGEDELSDTNYYEKGLYHDDQMASERNAIDFQDSVILKFESGLLTLQLPSSQGIEEFDLRILRPNEKAADKNFNLIDATPVGGNLFAIKVQSMSTGLWLAQITWRVNSEQYFLERELIIQ